MFDVLGEVADGTLAGVATAALALGGGIVALAKRTVTKKPRSVVPDPQVQKNAVKIGKVETRVDGLEKAIGQGFDATKEQIKGVHARVDRFNSDMNRQLDRIFRAANGKG